MKTVIEMAREAGGMDGWGGRGKRSDPELKSDEFVFDPEDLERFAELVRADEREACAKIVEESSLNDLLFQLRQLREENERMAKRIEDLEAMLERQTARIVDLQTHIKNFDGEDR